MKNLENKIKTDNISTDVVPDTSYYTWEFRLFSKFSDYLSRAGKKFCYGITALSLFGLLYSFGSGAKYVLERKQFMERLGIENSSIGIYKFRNDMSNSEIKDAWTRLEKYESNAASKILISIPLIFTLGAGIAAASIAKNKQKEK